MNVRGLILVMLLPLFAKAEQQYYGTHASSLFFEGTSSQADLQLIPLRNGDVITPENIRASIQALYDTGRYSYIEVDASPADGATRLTFRVRPHFFFSTFTLEPENLLDRPISAYVHLPLGETFSRSRVDKIVSDTAELLKARGYFEAAITPEFDFREDTRLVFVALRAKAGPRATAGNITVQGGEQTFSNKELLDAFDVAMGDTYSSDRLDAGLVKVREKFSELGFLNTRVNIEQTYRPSTQTVDLKLTISPGRFTLVQTRGYDISRRRLRELVPVFEEGTVDTDLVEEGRVQIENFLEEEGYFEAAVTSEIIEAPLDNAIQINYTITPGERHRISSIKIEGNEHFSDDDIQTRTQIRSAGFLDRGVFSPSLLEEDVQTIQAMYRAAGFTGTTVQGTFQETGHSVDVFIQINEGSRMRVDFLTFLGNFDFTNEQLRSAIEMAEGDIYTPSALDQARNALTGMYYERGYADVRIEPAVERVQTNGGVRVTFQITEGEAYTIGEILVAGNTTTQEKIVHRYTELYPNTPYNPEDILQAQQRLYATGLFARVEIMTLQQGLPDVRNLLIQVEDANPLLLTYGAGFHEFEGPRGTIEISHNNLFGLHRAISLRLRGSSKEQRVQSTYREPRLFNRNLDGFASLFVERSERPFVKRADRVDFSLQVLKRFKAQNNLLVTASYQTVNIEDPRVNRRTRETEEGIFQITRIGASYIQDRRDDPIEPAAGSFSTTTVQVASRVLRSEVSFTSLFNQTSHYWRTRGGVLASSVRLGWNRPFGDTDRLPITERYFAGGSTTLRGFDLDEAEPSGGNVMTIANLEYRVPLRQLPIRGVGGALFYDTGNVFTSISAIRLKDFTHTAGFGLRYATPLGPVRLDFGFNLRPRIIDGTREQRMQVFFTLGNPF